MFLFGREGNLLLWARKVFLRQAFSSSRHLGSY